MAPDLQPLPPPEATGPAPLLDNEALPPMDVVMVTTSALDDVLGSSMAERGNAERPAGEPEAPAYADPSEPALETLLRQAPRLQSPDTGPTPPASGELGRGPEPEELLTAVKQEVNTLAEALRRQGAEQQAGLQAAMAGAEQAARQQGRALEARQAEQWDRQQTALRQMHADQAAAIQSAITRQDEERAAWQQQAQPVSGQQLPAALRQLQDDLTQSQQLALHQSRDDLTQSQQLALRQLRDDLTQSQQLALHQLRDDLRRQPPTVVAATPPPSAPAPAQPAITADLQELNWQLEKAAVATQDLRQRVGQLLWVNLFLILVLLGLVAAVAWALWGRAPSPAPRPTVALTATRVPATAVPPTQAPPTLPPSTATRLPTPTAAATALPVFVAALACANADRPRNFYECTLTNTAKVTDTLSLAVQAAGDEFNGFRPSVSRESQENIQPDSLTGLFVVGEFAPGETQALRINLPCAVVTGCGETTFAFTPLVDRGQTLVANQVVEVTTHYFLP